ncbi:AAA family ATPase [Actinomadura hibisca]|uniref:AAA family ATPase n=1 Tax=Actinomadura hibisca TaxID=68565 RepID=UPI002480221E|nr:AAA family ATPase [Actinomadura hibisca]
MFVVLTTDDIFGADTRRAAIRELNESATHSTAHTAAHTTAHTTSLNYPAGALVLLAGLPGAGKSTLLDRLYGLRGDERAPVAVGSALVIDSRQARNWWARILRPVPPRARVPLVQLTHVWRITRAVRQGRSVIAHTRGTWPHILRGFAWLARRRGGEVHLILIDVAPRTARAGQYARGRVVTTATMARHIRLWRPLLEQAKRTGAVPPADGVTVLDRAAADRLKVIRFGPPVPPAPDGPPVSAAR